MTWALWFWKLRGKRQTEPSVISQSTNGEMRARKQNTIEGDAQNTRNT